MAEEPRKEAPTECPQCGARAWGHGYEEDAHGKRYTIRCQQCLAQYTLTPTGEWVRTK